MLIHVFGWGCGNIRVVVVVVDSRQLRRNWEEGKEADVVVVVVVALNPPRTLAAGKRRDLRHYNWWDNFKLAEKLTSSVLASSSNLLLCRRR